MAVDKLFSIEILAYNNKFYLAAAIIFFVTLVSYQFLTHFILKKLDNFCPKNDDKKTCLNEILSKPLGYFILLLGLNISWSLLPFSAEMIKRGDTLFTTLFIIIVFWVFVRLAEKLKLSAKKLAEKIELEIPNSVLDIAIHSLKALIIGIALLSILQAWGINVVAFLAGVGLIGIAIAFSAQELIKSIFGTLTLFIDRTYKKGDHICIGEFLEGTVEAIEMRFTIIKLKEGGIARISNSAILSEPIRNYTQKNYGK